MVWRRREEVSGAGGVRRWSSGAGMEIVWRAGKEVVQQHREGDGPMGGGGRWYGGAGRDMSWENGWNRMTERSDEFVGIR